MARTLVGHFTSRRAADAAYDELVQRGVPRDDISILGHGREGGAGLRDDDEHVGAGEGAAVGGITGLLLGAAAMLIPGIGPIVAVGPISAALAGAVTGGVTGAVVGGVTGALIDAGVDEDEARYYDERFKAGGVLLTVRTDDANRDQARMVLERHGGDVRGASVGSGATTAATTPATSATTTTSRWEDAMPRYRERWQQRYGTSGARWDEYEPTYRYGWEMRNDPRYRGRAFTEVEPELRRDWETRYPDKPWDRAAATLRETWDDVTDRDATPRRGTLDADRERTVQLREEELRAQKRPVEAGEVGLHKDVVTERRSMDVPVTREEVVVERHPVESRPASGPIREGEDVRVPVREEQVEVTKRPVVTEEVNVGKRTVQDTERVSDTVRREELRVDREGDVDVRGDQPPPRR